jgi:hypothetical protein
MTKEEFDMHRGIPINTNKNKYYGFYEDVEINCEPVYADACNRKKAAENAHSEAVDLIIHKINNFFRYLEGLDVMDYVDESVAAKEILHSLAEVGNVPKILILDSAYKLSTDMHLRHYPLESTKRIRIVSKLIRYLENSHPNPQINPQTLEFEYPLPNVPTSVESNN